MFERFTDGARRVVVLAQEQAVAFNHDYIGTEHLLLALLAERDSAAVRILRAAGTDLEQLRETVMKLAADGFENLDPSERAHSLMNEIRRLRDLLRKHGIDPSEPGEPQT